MLTVKKQISSLFLLFAIALPLSSYSYRRMASLRRSASLRMASSILDTKALADYASVFYKVYADGNEVETSFDQGEVNFVINGMGSINMQ